MRRLLVTMTTVILLGVTGFVVWAALTARVSYVVTNGVSMLPLYHGGDLVVVAKQDSYRVGDIVAYRQGEVTILHRVIDGDAGGFVTKGDSNKSIDPGRPTSAQLKGRAVLHIPAGGTWARRATSPPVLAAAGFMLVMGLGASVRRRRGRDRRRGAVGRHADPAGGTATAGGLAANFSPRGRAAAGVIVAVGLAGAVLGVVAWTRPVATSVSARPPPARTMAFSYSATVPRTPAYDGTTITSPEPIFRRVAKHVDVTFRYQGLPGRIGVAAELSVAGGWHTTVPLARERPFTGGTYQGVVRLDLDALEVRADAGAEAAGLAASEVAVAVVPRVTGGTGVPFAPALNLRLTSATLTLGGGSLVVTSAGPAPEKVTVPQSLRAFGREIVGVSTARTASAVLVSLAVLAAVALVGLARPRKVAEGEAIRRRYGKLLIEVAPMAPPPGRPAVRVTAFKTLARLAERYGLLVLHWSTPRSATFVVPDDAVTYWYCTDPTTVSLPAPAPMPPSEAVPAGPSESPAGPSESLAGPSESLAGLALVPVRWPPPVADPRPAASDIEPPTHWQLALPGAQDTVTRLANRSLFEAEVQIALDASGGERLCLILIDLGGLDDFEAEHGRQASDALLVATAERLRGVVRPRDLVARLEGDVFAVLFENVGTAEIAVIAERMERTVNEPIAVHGERVRVRASLGIVQAGPGRDATALIGHATAALAEAKAMTGAPRSGSPGPGAPAAVVPDPAMSDAALPGTAAKGTAAKGTTAKGTASPGEAGGPDSVGGG